MGLSNPDTCSVVGVYDDKIVLMSYEAADNIYGQLASYYVIAIRISIIEKLPFTYKDEYDVDIPMQIMAVTTDGFMLHAGYETTYKTAYDMAGQAFESPVDDPIYYLIDFESFYSGTPNYTPVENIG